MIDFGVFGQPAWRQLVFALLHTIWQGGLIAAATAATLRRLPARRQHARYLIALGGQFGVLLAGLLTWAALGYETHRYVGSSAHVLVAPATNLVFNDPTVHGVESRSPISEPTAAVNWVPIAAVGWLAGVALMLARTAASALAAAGLTRGAGAVDAAILEAVDALRREIGIGRRVRVVSCDRCPVPAVLGLFWPTVVLPVSMMTGLGPEAVRAILAHELEHIRRYDYVVNLAQMAVESVLFFNPAVWWLGRQARVEREACCDAAAVRLTGRPLEYSRVLADWAGQVGASTPAVALAWSGGGRPSALRERVLRVLRPGETPRARVSWSGLIVLLVAAPLVLFALSCGANKAVDVAVKALSPSERVEKLEAAKAEYAPREVDDEDKRKATLKGTLRAPDGTPVTKAVEAAAIVKNGNGSGFYSLNPVKDAFSVEVHPGTVWLSLAPKDYAPVMAGPFRAKPGETVEGIDLVFEPGFPARIRVVDEKGAPVVGAKVSGGLTVQGGTMYSAAGLATDADGVVTVAHASTRPYQFSAQAKGFQKLEVSRNLTLSPTETATLTLNHSHPATGVVVGPDGKPIAGAKIRPYAWFKPNYSRYYGTTEPVMATTDLDGRFTLDALDDGTEFVMLVETDLQGRRLVEGVRPGQEGLKWSVGPDLTISGTIKGDLTALEKVRGKPVVEVAQRGRKKGSDGRGLSPIRTTAAVERVEGGGRFKLTGVLPGEVVVTAGEHVVMLDVVKPDNPVTIDLTRAAAHPRNRKVVVRIRTPEGAPSASGRLEGYATDASVDQVYKHIMLPLKEGEVSFETPAPGRVSYQSRSVIGYWFKDDGFEVPPGDRPLLIEVKSVPAGAIVGRVLDADDKPAVSEVSMAISTVEKPKGFKPDDFIQLNNVTVDPEGRFFLGPLPIGGTYVVVAARGHNKQVSKPVRLDGSKATDQVELRLSRPSTGGGRVVGPDGKPLAGVDVTLVLEHPQAGTSWSPPTPTDGDGRFEFDDLSPDLRTYAVEIDTREGYVPVSATLNPGGKAVEVRLQRGRLVTGRVVDAKTGWPIPGVQVYATPKPFKVGERSRFDPEGLTDEQGRFRFSNLPAGVFQLGDGNGLQNGATRAVEFSTDGAGPVEIRGTLPHWSKLKPVAPKGG